MSATKNTINSFKLKRGEPRLQAQPGTRGVGVV